ncbi:pseudaminic acid cytidylyltransferase [Thiomicrorhabdus indica]|uniref:pseudaminic acid cytidylyltransferase n=1 Tax=Thiomicrorhabdus indica TaxID=2267253 RepID=UPI00102DA9EC|nr:pseudaminic acid cytidylyltransferase [Thiomicrorhabdus indica]
MKICVIPARGGSKRIPRKNIKEFAGKRMICYAIEAAKKANIFDEIYVSSESIEIQDIAEEAGISVIQRPEELADDHTTTNAVIAHAIEYLGSIGKSCDLVACIYPCVPFIRVEDLQEAYRIIDESLEPSYVFPVTEFPSHVKRALQRDSLGKMSPLFQENTFKRSQDLEKVYYDVGQFYIGTVDAWLSGKSPHEIGAGMVIPHWRVVDIDTPEDWFFAELIYEALVQRGKL